MPPAFRSPNEALWHAVFHGDVIDMEAAIEAGADPHLTDGDGCTLVHATVARGTNSYLPYLFQQGIDLNAQNHQGQTALHQAVWRNNLTGLVDLLDAGADPLIQDFDGWSTLHAAAFVPNTSMVTALLNAGVPVDVRGHDGTEEQRTPLLLLASQEDDDGTFEPMVGDIVALLLECGADPNAADGNGQTVLHWLAQLNKPHLVPFLLEAGGDPNRLDNYGKSPLHVALDTPLNMPIPRHDHYPRRLVRMVTLLAPHVNDDVFYQKQKGRLSRETTLFSPPHVLALARSLQPSYPMVYDTVMLDHRRRERSRLMSIPHPTGHPLGTTAVRL